MDGLQKCKFWLNIFIINSFISSKKLVEYSVSGILNYSPPTILLFKLSMYSNPDGNLFQGAFGTMIFIMVGLCIFICYQIVRKNIFGWYKNLFLRVLNIITMRGCFLIWFHLWGFWIVQFSWFYWQSLLMAIVCTIHLTMATKFLQINTLWYIYS